jgi:hypothetical protein
VYGYCLLPPAPIPDDSEDSFLCPLGLACTLACLFLSSERANFLPQVSQPKGFSPAMSGGVSLGTNKTTETNLIPTGVGPDVGGEVVRAREGPQADGALNGWHRLAP